MSDNIIDLSCCSACGKRLVEADGRIRCSGPKGCGREYEALPFGSRLDIVAPHGPQSIKPIDTIARSPTRTAVAPDGRVYKTKVRP